MADPTEIKVSYEEDPFNLIYTDIFRMSYSLTTFSLEYSQQLPREATEAPRCRYTGTLLMSPQGAKILLGLLQHQVANYEKTNGEIKIKV
jgi:hypothetical protein